ncbi:MAG: hypothetical protein EXQ55_02090 [Acidobacteria bacterium]|nr:hypothetical protein [Acidobacteriota bacterium]
MHQKSHDPGSLPAARCSWSVLVGISVLAGSGAACDVQVRDGKPSFGLNRPQATQEWHRQYPLAAGGQVEVANLNGPIELSPGSPGTVDIQATITAKALTEAQAKELLSKGRITETVQPDRIKVETVVPRGVRGSYEVRYRVSVPADAVSTVSTTNGSFKATGLAGSLKASIVNGQVELTDIGGEVDVVGVNGSLTAKLIRISAPVRLETTNGQLSVQFPSASKAHLSARVVNGGLTVSGLETQEPIGNRIKNLEAVLNGGGPEIDLRTTNGQILIMGTP